MAERLRTLIGPADERVGAVMCRKPRDQITLVVTAQRRKNSHSMTILIAAVIGFAGSSGQQQILDDQHIEPAIIRVLARGETRHRCDAGRIRFSICLCAGSDLEIGA